MMSSIQRADFQTSLNQPALPKEKPSENKKALRNRSAKVALALFAAAGGAYTLKNAFDRHTQCQNASFAKTFPSTRRKVQEEFNYTTRTIDVEAQLSGKNIQPEEIQSLKASLLEGDYKSPIFEDATRFPYVALQAFSDKVIGKEEFTNVMFYWSVRKHHSADEIQVVQLCDACREPNQSAREALLKTFDPTPLSQTHLGANLGIDDSDDPVGPFLDQAGQEKFLTRLAKLPRSAQTFFVYPDIQADFKSQGLENMADQIVKGEITISQEIQKATRINIFNRIEMNGKTLRMTPSFEMMQQAVKIMSGANAVTITPTIGLSSLEDIRQNGLKAQRDLGVPFPGVQLPLTADSLKCTEAYDFSYHDFYHAIRASQMPDADRKFLIKFSDLVTTAATPEEQKKYPQLPKYIQELSERILDMEHPIYQKEYFEAMQPQVKSMGLQDPMKSRNLLAIDLSIMNTFNRLNIAQAAKANAQGAKIGGSEMAQNMLDVAQDLSCSGYPVTLAKRVVQTFSSLPTNTSQVCRQFIEYGSIAEKMLPQMAEMSGMHIEALQRSNLFFQAKEMCQKPWLLA